MSKLPTNLLMGPGDDEDSRLNMRRKSRRGFASLTPERLRELASKGGKTAHAKGTAHKFTSEEAKAAGAKGGRAAKKRKEQDDGIPS